MARQRQGRLPLRTAQPPPAGAHQDKPPRRHKNDRDRRQDTRGSRQLAGSLRRLGFMAVAAAATNVHRVAFALCILLTCGPAFATAASQLRVPANSLSHVNLIRTVDLTTGGNVRETISVSVENAGKQAVTEYHVAVPLSRPRNVAHFSCTDKKTGEKLSMQKDVVEEKRKLQYYKITMVPPLDPSHSRIMTVRFTFTGLLTPLPLSVHQNDRQRLYYEGNVYFVSPYPSKKQKIVFRFPSGAIESVSDTPSPVDRSGSIITYGPYENVTAFAEEPFSAHFECLKSVVAVKNLVRSLEISHWGGNAAVEEHYHFVHVGPRLKGHFRRFDYQLHQQDQHRMPVVQSLNLVLPRSARDPYYRDPIGNVSTSNFRLEGSLNRSLLQLRPRYPLYGGWNYTCYIGYNMPLDEVVRVPNHVDDKRRGRYMLRAPFVHKIDGMDTWYENVELKIVLPEGSRNVEFNVPFPIAGSKNSTTHTYLDTIGRPTLHLFLHMLAPDDGQLLFEVTYDLPALELLRKPFTVAAAFMAVFISWMLFSRVETRIAPRKA